MKKALIRCVFFLFLVLALALPAAAADGTLENERIEQEYEAFLQSIPPEVADLLPDGFVQSPPQEAGESLQRAGGISAVWDVLERVTGLALRENLALLARICGLLVLAAVFRALCPQGKEGAGKAFSLCTTLALTVLLLSAQEGRFARLETFFNTVSAVCASFMPLMGTLYAMGGNVRSAAVNQGVLSGFLSVLETFCAGSVLPIAGICLAFAMLDAVTGRAQLRGLAGVIKRTYTLMISFLMGIFCFVLGTQSTLAKAGDTLALRTARFAAGSFLPLVGGSVSEALRTVAGSVTYLRGVAGTGAILVIFFAFLPTFLSVMLTRVAFLLAGSVADMLSCPAEGKLLSELSSVYGYFLAIIAVLFVTVLFSLTIFAQCAAAG